MPNFRTVSKKAKPEDLMTFSNPAAPPAARAIALSRLATEPHPELESTLAELLDHEDSTLRAEALTTLLGVYRIEAYLERGLACLVEDGDWLCRSSAAAALASYVSRRPENDPERTVVLRALARCLKQEPEPEVLEGAYEALLRVLDRPAEEHFYAARTFDSSRDVNWALVEPYLAGPAD